MKKEDWKDIWSFTQIALLYTLGVTLVVLTVGVIAEAVR